MEGSLQLYETCEYAPNGLQGRCFTSCQRQQVVHPPPQHAAHDLHEFADEVSSAEKLRMVVTQQERKPPRTGFHWPRRSSRKPKQVTDSTPEEGTSAAVAPAAAAATAKHRRVSRKERLPQDMELSTFLTSEEKAEQGEELRTLAVTHGRTQVGPYHQLPPRNLHDQCLHSKTYVLPVCCVVFCRC